MAKKSGKTDAAQAARSGLTSRRALIDALLSYEGNNRTRADAGRLLDALANVIAVELKRGGVVTIPGVVRLAAVAKPAAPERAGINPFTKEPTTFKARPATVQVKARPVRALTAGVRSGRADAAGGD